METVSIVIPVYNSEKYIERCVRSILHQSYKALDVIAIDDGSVDRSGYLLDRLAETDQRLKVIHQENKGVSVARNFGVQTATGKYLTFVDSDDYIDKEYIRELVKCAEENHADMVVCGYTMIDTEEKKLKTIIPGEYIRNSKEEWIFRIAATWSHLYRLELWKKYQIYFADGVRGEDMPISLFFSAMCDNINTIPKAGYYYVQHENSAMQNFRGLDHYQLPYKALEEVIQKVKKIGIHNSEKYFELFVMRIMATCLFDLGRGASKNKIQELCTYIEHVLNTYFPNYYKNKYICLFSKIELPFVQKAAVQALVFLVRFHILCPVSVWLLGR